MSEDRLSLALARIEKACTRAERALQKSRRPGETDSSRIAELEARHARLRSRVEEAIGELDQLLGESVGG
jgi:hypothetical protein